MARNGSLILLSQAFLVCALVAPSRPALWAWIAVWFGAQACFLLGMLRPRSSIFGRSLSRVPGQPRVALTFDDGPHPEDTPAILKILEKTGAGATFFFVGDRARRHPDLVRRVVKAGHEVAPHSDTHPWWFSLAGRRRLRREVREATESIGRLAGRRPRHFRPPMGHKNLFLDEELRAADLRQVTWSVRPYDTLGRPPAKIRRSVLAQASPGSIILLHEGVRRRPGGVSATVAALEGIILGLRDRGLEPVSLESLRSAPRVPARPGPLASTAGGNASGTS